MQSLCRQVQGTAASVSKNEDVLAGLRGYPRDPERISSRPDEDILADRQAQDTMSEAGGMVGRIH